MKKFVIPIALFALLGVLLWSGLALDPRKIPSPLIGKPLPAFALPTLANPKRSLSPNDLRGRVYLLNVWASWCTACRQEHPVLLEIARQKGAPIVGLNYKDQRADALGWLKEKGIQPHCAAIFEGEDEGEYDVIIMDYQIVGPLTGEKLIRKIKAIDPKDGSIKKFNYLV